jgi:hypothetical protein
MGQKRHQQASCLFRRDSIRIAAVPVVAFQAIKPVRHVKGNVVDLLTREAIISRRDRTRN